LLDSVALVELMHNFYSSNKSDEHEMEMEFEKTPTLATKLKAVSHPEDILFRDREGLTFANDLEAIVKSADAITVFYDHRIREVALQY
jgi:hypothetical protein